MLRNATMLHLKVSYGPAQVKNGQIDFFVVYVPFVANSIASHPWSSV